MLIALTRPVSPNIVHCELTHLTRQPIDVGRALAQHQQYEEALGAMGCTIERLAPEPDLSDAVFVEDMAVVLPELAVIARPGAPTRRGEVASVVAAVGRYRRLRYIEEPGTLDGGDVLVVGRRVYVGISSRTNEQGMAQLGTLLEPLGYRVYAATVQGCLHLKSAVTAVGDDLLLLNPDRVDQALFEGLDCIAVHPGEAFAANALRVGSGVLCAAHAPDTYEKLQKRGLNVKVVDMSELAKAEGALTCCSLLIEGITGEK